jgi:hypothetical protein
MDRRAFIEMAAAGALGLGLPGRSPRTAPSAPLRALAQPGLLTLLGDARRVRDIGVQYRASHPAERDATALRAALLAGTPGDAPAAALPGLLDAQVRDDFAAGRTVVVRGWVLARTEARQCALFSLLHP